MDTFAIGDRVKITLTGISGEVVGVYDYKGMPRRFTVRYGDKSGVVREDAFEDDQITAAA